MEVFLIFFYQAVAPIVRARRVSLVVEFRNHQRNVAGTFPAKP